MASFFGAFGSLPSPPQQSLDGAYASPGSHLVMDAEEPFISAPELSSDGRDLQEELERRILSEDFQSAGLNLNNHVTLADLIHKLRRAKRTYDEEMLKRLFAAQTGDGRSVGDGKCGITVCASDDDDDDSVRAITINCKQLMDAYLKRKKELATVLEISYRELESSERMMLQAEENLRKHSNQSDMSAPGPTGRGSLNGAFGSEESKLTVQVASIQGVREPDPSNPSLFKIHLECQDQVIETRTSYLSQGSAFFNEMFSFEIHRRDGDLRFRLIQVEPYARSEHVIGDCSIMIDDLGDQRKHDITKEVWGGEGAEILLSCQWIYSKKTLYQTYLREFSLKRDQKLREISDYQQEFDKLNKPFIFEDSGGVAGLFAFGPEYFSKSIDQLMINMKLSNWQMASQYVVGILFFLACVASYSRALFADLIISGMAFWCNLDARRWTINRYSILMMSTAASLIFDFYWMKLYFQAWTIGSIESDLHNITKIFSIFLFLWKVVTIIFLWKCRYDLRKKLSYHHRVGAIQSVARALDSRSTNDATGGGVEKGGGCLGGSIPANASTQYVSLPQSNSPWAGR